LKSIVVLSDIRHYGLPIEPDVCGGWHRPLL